MEPLSPELLLIYAVFIRTSTAVLLLPGVSSAQVAVRVRLLLAIALSASVFFMVEEQVNSPLFLQEPDLEWIVRLTVGEMVIAAILILPIRLLFLGLAFAGEFTSNLIGLNPIPGTPIGSDEAVPTLAAFYNIMALVLFFASGVHLHIVMGFALAYEPFPPGVLLNLSAVVESLANQMAEFFHIALRLSAPLLVFSVAVNFVAGIVNKLTPQVPIYFVSAPFLILGGYYILLLVAKDLLYEFNVEVLKLVNAIF